MLQQLKQLSAARARARAIERRGTLDRQVLPVQAAQRTIDHALGGIVSQLSQRYRPSSAKITGHGAPHAPSRRTTSGLSAEAATPSAATSPHCAELGRASAEEASSTNESSTRVIVNHGAATLGPVAGHAQAPSLGLVSTPSAVAEVSAAGGGVRQPLKGMPTRKSSQLHAPGARTYSTWLAKSDIVRQSISTHLGQGAADNIVLTGSTRMEGKVTSLVMISQSMAQQRKVVAALRRQKCFDSTNGVHLSMISSVARTHHHARYSTVYREGAMAHTFFVLVQGRVMQSTSDGTSELLRVHGKAADLICFGTEGLTGGLSRSATVTCVDNCEILHFSTFRMRLSETGVKALAQRAFATFVESELQKMPLFFGLRGPALGEISTMFELREHHTAGTVIYQPGMAADALYILVKGRVVLEDSSGIQLAKLQAGSIQDGFPFFGERSVIESGSRTTSATTRTPVKLLVLRQYYFARMMRLMPHLVDRLQRLCMLRHSMAEQARLAASVQAQRCAIETAARGRELGLKQGRDCRTNDLAGRTLASAEEASPDDAAATCVQRHWRGGQARERKA